MIRKFSSLVKRTTRKMRSEKVLNKWLRGNSNKRRLIDSISHAVREFLMYEKHENIPAEMEGHAVFIEITIGRAKHSTYAGLPLLRTKT